MTLPLEETPSQTSGPYVQLGLLPGSAGHESGVQALGQWGIPADVAGARIRVIGRVIDGFGVPVVDCVVEAWQADARGRFAARDSGNPSPPAFRGWARTAPVPEDGTWRITTIRPGAVSLPDGTVMAPHISLWVVARGINVGLLTRMYFADEAAANAKDPVLKMVEGAEGITRRSTLIACLADDSRGAPDLPTWHFDIRLQGEGETVFFDF